MARKFELTQSQKDRMYAYLDSLKINKSTGTEQTFRNEEKIPEDEREIVKYIASIRHELHSHGSKIFFNNNNGKGSDGALQIKRFLLSLTANEVFKTGNIPFPYEICEEYKHIKRFDKFVKEHTDFTESMFKDVIRAFHYDKERLNEAFERYLENVDEKYGTNFKPECKMRRRFRHQGMSDDDLKTYMEERTIKEVVKYYEENFGELVKSTDVPIPRIDSEYIETSILEEDLDMPPPLPDFTTPNVLEHNVQRGL